MTSYLSQRCCEADYRYERWALVPILCSTSSAGNPFLSCSTARTSSMTLIPGRCTESDAPAKTLIVIISYISRFGRRCQTSEAAQSDAVSPFWSYFPMRCYLNDFEFAVTFDRHSKSSSRVVTGLPITGIRSGDYGRDVAPECFPDNHTARFVRMFGGWVLCSSRILR